MWTTGAEAPVVLEKVTKRYGRADTTLITFRVMTRPERALAAG